MSSREIEQLCATLIDAGNALEALGVSIKRQVSEIMQVESGEIPEETFKILLGWTQRTGDKLGVFEVTSRSSNNNSNGYSHAFNILKVNNATINNRYHGEGYAFAYWLYKDDTYRQKLGNKKTN